MKDKPENPQAFPSYELDYTESSIQGRNVIQDTYRGMLLRDYFAAKAMQDELMNFGERTSMSRVAEQSYLMANAMLAERSKSDE